MARYYAISDPHGCLDVLEQALSVIDLSIPENRLFLLGDYIPHYRYPDTIEDFLSDCTIALRYVKNFCEKHPRQVIALKGNHEFDLLNNVREGTWWLDKDLLKWIEPLPLYYETDKQIFVHAGIEEDAEDLWRLGTDDIMFCWKFPPTFGSFLKDIVAGHVATSKMHGNINEHDVFWDGESHYYLDGTTEGFGTMPVLIYDTETNAYTSRLATASGVDYESPIPPKTPARF